MDEKVLPMNVDDDTACVLLLPNFSPPLLYRRTTQTQTKHPENKHQHQQQHTNDGWSVMGVWKLLPRGDMTHDDTSCDYITTLTPAETTNDSQPRYPSVATAVEIRCRRRDS